MIRFKLVLVDDEPAAREGLQALLASDPEIDVVASCKNGLEAIQAIDQHRPDIVLLDIQMPEITGFDVLRSITAPWPQIIFITAYDQYAIQAFSYHALDYLLKPFSDERFYQSLTRSKEMARQRHATDLSKKMLEILQSNIEGGATLVGNEKTTTALKKLVVKDSGKVILIPWEEIVYIKADDYVVRIQYLNKETVVRESLKKLETILPADQFVRTHKSYIVNLTKILEIENDLGGGLLLRLVDKSVIPVSKHYKDTLSQKLGLS
jgi:two-component system LytT family response regulator